METLGFLHNVLNVQAQNKDAKPHHVLKFALNWRTRSVFSLRFQHASLVDRDHR